MSKYLPLNNKFLEFNLQLSAEFKKKMLFITVLTLKTERSMALTTTPTSDDIDEDDDDDDDEMDEIDSTEIDDDGKIYKNPRNSPSTLCPRDEEQATLLVEQMIHQKIVHVFHLTDVIIFRDKSV